MRQAENKANMSRHYSTDSETRGFADWLNSKLGKKQELTKYMPLNVENFFERLSDGVILCKYVENINDSVIDSRAINTGNNLLIYHKHENCQLAISASTSLGCCTVNVGPVDIQEKNEHIVKGLVWQQIRMDLLQSITLANHPNILVLMQEGETLEEFKRLSPEEILIRWVNYHLARSDHSHLQLNKFATDLQDSQIYGVLLQEISPKNPSDPMVVRHGRVQMIDLGETNWETRAKNMLDEAAKIECNVFVQPKDVVSGNLHLNLAFTANLFNMYPALEDVEYEEVQETREMKSIRNWVNSLGVSPILKDLRTDLGDGLVYCQILNIFQPNCISLKDISRELSGPKGKFNRTANCALAIKCGKDKFGFSLVNIDGSNLSGNNIMFILSFLSQAMRYDFIRMLRKIDPNKTFTDADILEWVNSKLGRPVTGFKDPAFSDSVPIFDLIESLKENMFNKAHINNQDTFEAKYSNARLACSVVRKMGGKVFALPEDVVECVPRPIMLLCAALMIIDYGNH